MGVSTRNTLLAGLVTATAIAITGAASAAGGMGDAGALPGNGISTGPGLVIPGTDTGAQGSSGCCGSLPTGVNVSLPGVNIAGPHISVTSPNVSVRQGNVIVGGTSVVTNSVSSSHQGSTFLSGGGAYFAPQGIAPTTLQGLNVTGGEERYTETITEQVPVREEICVPQQRQTIAVRPVQAVCLDDTGNPHPASQVTGDREIGERFTGEIYRCMAGTSMQVTLGQINGSEADFTRAQTFSCQRGEALVRQSTGNLVCAPQIPQRDCNERSLLRQYGSGVKLIQTRATVESCVPQTRTRMQTVQREVERVRATAPAGPIVLDGGVGQSVF